MTPSSLSLPFFIVEYDAIGRLGITDPHKYIKQRYKSHDLLMLDSCCLATRVISEVDGCVQEEVRRTEKWVDILVSIFEIHKVVVIIIVIVVIIVIVILLLLLLLANTTSSMFKYRC